MIVRLIAALVGIAIVIPTLIFGGVLGVQMLTAVIVTIGMSEYVTIAMGKSSTNGLKAWMIALSLLVWYGFVFVPLHATSFLLGASILLFLSSLFLFSTNEHGAKGLYRLGTGLIYIPVLSSYIVFLRSVSDTDSSDIGLIWIFLLLTITWCGDTGAYFAGRFLGKRKLFPRVSPKKTIEGAVGGYVMALIGASVVKYIALPEVSWAHLVVCTICINTTGILGDLIESMLKRESGVKDSGNIMPGHGGILDRVDSLLFTAPTAWLYATIFIYS